jgi:glycosyltransferase involved in cell wall biosynthesis
VSDKDRFDIVYFSSIDWNHTWQRPQQLASRLARYGKVLYISPLGLRSVVLTDWARILRRIAFEFSRPVTASNQRLTVHTPLLYLPLPESPLANRINGWLLHRTIAQWMKRHQIHRPIVWMGVPSPVALEAIKSIEVRLTVYDCLDNFSLFHQDAPYIVEAEQQIVSRTQIVFATAAELLERMKLINPRTYLLPNAADYEHFAYDAIRDLPPPREMASLRKPILGYIGEMAQWFDFDLVHNVALQHPAWNIVLIGLVHVDLAHKLFRLPNVFPLGRKSYSELPAYLRCFDLCLLPFKINALTSAVNPVKLYEYLAAGKPVVSTPMREVWQYQDVVRIAERSEFSAAIKTELETDSEAKIQQRLVVARRNTWDQRIEEILRLLDPALAGVCQ